MRHRLSKRPVLYSINSDWTDSPFATKTLSVEGEVSIMFVLSNVTCVDAIKSENYDLNVLSKLNQILAKRF